MQEFLAALAALEGLEVIGMVSGLVCVWLLIRQNIWTWPIGIVYSIVSLVVMYRAQLYAGLLENLYYLAMNAYGWYYWTVGAGSNQGALDFDANEVPVTSMPTRYWIVVVIVIVVGAAAMGTAFDAYTDADIPYINSATTVTVFVAMWMTARKYIENWPVWLAVDIAFAFIYFHKGIAPYALLYGVYIVMAVWGWRAWRTTLAPA